MILRPLLLLLTLLITGGAWPVPARSLPARAHQRALHFAASGRNGGVSPLTFRQRWFQGVCRLVLLCASSARAYQARALRSASRAEAEDPERYPDYIAANNPGDDADYWRVPPSHLAAAARLRVLTVFRRFYNHDSLFADYYVRAPRCVLWPATRAYQHSLPQYGNNPWIDRWTTPRMQNGGGGGDGGPASAPVGAPALPPAPRPTIRACCRANSFDGNDDASIFVQLPFEISFYGAGRAVDIVARVR